jgi:site-specific DNA recombinase
MPALRDEAAGVRGRLDALAGEFADGTLTASQLRIATERLRARLAALEAQIADAGRVDLLGSVVQADDVQAAWNGLSTDRRRAVVDALMIVRLHPVGRGVRTFRADTVEIEWKGEAT